MTHNVELSRATCHTDEDWIAVRDPQGHLWCEYHPTRQVVRKYCKIDGSRYYGEIAIDDLIAGNYTAKRTPRQ